VGGLIDYKFLEKAVFYFRSPQAPLIKGGIKGGIKKMGDY